GDLLAGRELGCIFHQRAAGIKDQSITALENPDRGERVDLRGEPVHARTMSGKIGAKCARQGFRAGLQPATGNGQPTPKIKMANASSGNLQTAMLLMQQRAIVSHQPVGQVIEALRALRHKIAYAGKSAMLSELLELAAGDQ